MQRTNRGEGVQGALDGGKRRGAFAPGATKHTARMQDEGRLCTGGSKRVGFVRYNGRYCSMMSKYGPDSGVEAGSLSSGGLAGPC